MANKKKNWVFVNHNEDVWVVVGEEGQDPPLSVTVYEGVSDEVVAELDDQGYGLGGDIMPKLQQFPQSGF